MSNFRNSAFILVSILALTLLSFFRFPGHTYLQSDTQIYVPMLEHFWDPSVLQHDFMVQRPHVAFTVYDEATLALRRLTGLGLEEALKGQQFLTRALGLLGIFLIASSLRLGVRMSLLVAGVFSLGASIGGPTVLTIEYEPVPRGFALPLLLLAAGLLAHGHDLGAGVAASLAFLYHPSTTLAFWAVYFGLAVWPAGFAAMRRRVMGLFPLLIAVFLLLLASRHQTGVTESPVFLAPLAPWWESLLRLRATYVWVSLWYPRWYWHYGVLWIISVAAYWRLRRDVTADLRPFLIGLPLLGVLSMPASYLLLEVGGLALAPQLQIARNVLFVSLVAGVLASAAGVVAARNGRPGESLLWFVAAFALPAVGLGRTTVLPSWNDPQFHRCALLVILLAGAASLICWANAKGLRWGAPAWVAMLLVPFFVYPVIKPLNHLTERQGQDLEALSGWARSSTEKEAVFLFPDAGRDLYPGVFRARALRAVYVDWKSGGQGNYLPSVGQEWWRRWHALGALKYEPGSPTRFARFGVDYVVLRKQNAEPDLKPVYRNPEFTVYSTR